MQSFIGTLTFFSRKGIFLKKYELNPELQLSQFINFNKYKIIILVANDLKLEEELRNLAENLQKIELFYKSKAAFKLFILLINNQRSKKYNLSQKTEVFDEKRWYWKGMKESKNILYFYENFKEANLVDVRNCIVLEAERKLREAPMLKKKETLSQIVPAEETGPEDKTDRKKVDIYSSCRVFWWFLFIREDMGCLCLQVLNFW